MASRGLCPEDLTPYKLGFVADPLPGHEQYRGMLAIPYIRFSDLGKPSVASLRFRCLVEGCQHEFHGKYNTVAGDQPRLYNTKALLQSTDQVAVTEGELDAITLDAVCGVPAVGLPGVSSWKDYFREPFLGFETVWIFADGDQPGTAAAKKLADILPNSRVVQLPPEEDVNSLVVKEGPEAIQRRIQSD